MFKQLLCASMLFLTLCTHTMGNDFDGIGELYQEPGVVDLTQYDFDPAQRANNPVLVGPNYVVDPLNQVLETGVASLCPIL